MSRILYVNKYADNSGAPRHLFHLLRAARSRHDVSLCVGVDSPELTALSAAGVPIHRLDVLGADASPLQIVRSALALRRLLIDEKPDLVHVHSPAAGFAARIAAASVGIPCVFTAHGWNFAPGLSRKRRLASWALEWLAARFGHAIIAVSTYDGTLARRARIATAPQLQVIRNGIEDKPLPAASGRQACPTIVMVARFSEQKRQEDLIRAVVAFPCPVRVRFVGDGERRASCMELASALGIAGSIDFLGELASAEDELSRADIFVLCSNYEGLPLSILEAMRAGLPVLASDVGGVSDAVLDGITGYLSAPGDVDALRRHLISLVDDPALRSRLGLQGRAHFEQQFTDTRMLNETFALYARLLAAL